MRLRVSLAAAVWRNHTCEHAASRDERLQKLRKYRSNPCHNLISKDDYKTLLAGQEDNDLPVSYFLVDSWWYRERKHGGAWMWEDTPELVNDSFPGNTTHPGMKRLSAELGGMPFKAHAGGYGRHEIAPKAGFSRRREIQIGSNCMIH